MALAIFDLDNTLLNGDSDHAWGEFLIQNKIVDSETYKSRNDQFYADYKRGELDIFAYLEFALEPLTRFSNAELEALHQRFMAESVSKMRLQKADALLQKHRDQGDFLLIITATNKFVTGPIGKALGVDDLLASDPEIINGIYTGKVAGTPCYQEGKVSRLNDWLEGKPYTLQESYFYSDSMNDLPLLKQVGNPIAVDADDTLTAYAEAHQWPIISLRDA